MGKTIFITEKPSVAQEYRKVLKVTGAAKTNGYIEGRSERLNKDVIITWAVGHLIGICQPEQHNPDWKEWRAENLPMIPSRFKYTPLKSSIDQFKVVQALYTRKDIECIYYAGDSGREGIYIQALIRDYIFKNNTPNITEKVVWIDSFTEEAILSGIRAAKPYASYKNMIDSGYARAETDWLIGMNFSRSFSITSGSVRVGRVMTPTLAMIVNRQKEIDEFIKTPYFGIKADNFAAWKAVKGTRFFESDVLYNENGFRKREDAAALINSLNGSKKLTVENVKVQNKTEYAPYLFNLADLQAVCSKKLHISPTKSLEMAQLLYERKFTTYPRTDCRFLSTAVQKDLKGHGFNVPDRYVDDSKITDHYAIIPTFQGDPKTLLKETNGQLAKTVYDLIYKRFTDILLPPYLYQSVSIIYGHQSGEKFFEGYRIDKQLGFKEKADKDDQSQNAEKSLNKPAPKQGDVVSVTDFILNPMETTPPHAYTTGSLILAMEKAGKLIDDEELREQIKTCGIGTSATRANIIEKLENNGYITIDKKQKVAPTETGKAIVAVIAKFDEALVSPIKTADMENKLSAIVDGKLPTSTYYNEVVQYVKDTTKRVLAENTTRISNGSKGGTTETYNCPCCGKALNYGRYGWYHADKSCAFSLSSEICGSKMTEKDLASIIKKGKTGVHSFKSKAGKPFKAALVLNKNTRNLDFEFVKDSPQSKKKHW